MAIVRVQSKTAANAVATTISVTLDSTPTDGNFLVLFVGDLGATANRVTSISQTGATWVRAVQATNALGSQGEIWYAENIASASTSITVNLAASLAAGCVVAEYSGIAIASTLDKTASSTGSGPPASTGTTATTAQAQELWLGGLTINAGTTFIGSLSNSFTQVGLVSSGLCRVEMAEKIVSATGTANTTDDIELSAEGEPWAGAIATFKAPVTFIPKIMVLS